MATKNSRQTNFQAEVEKITKLISKEIYSGHRLPHEHLVENKLAESYSVSRMIIRQVLVRLESIGLVAIEPYKGATVAPITIKRIRSEYEIVGMMEGYATKLATEHITKSDITKLEKSLADQKKLTENDTQKWLQLNRNFHQVINRRCGNEKLTALLRQHVQFTNYWFLASSNDIIFQNVEYHERILAALKKKDAEAARKNMEEHIISVCDRLIEHIQKNIPIGAFRLS